ncbi:DNA ligase [Variovorax sp. HJSM1_2]|uniref:DNA ligase n=1 Tax=Variovorax sp. HJSM1_2 TaxID=3366263 RepID=UPI003BC4EC44
MTRRRLLWSGLGSGLVLAKPAAATPAAPVKKAAAPELMLANVYHNGLPLSDYWVSEKYDGVRGYWDGKSLRTRNGETVHAPTWFTAAWPTTPLDGELWAGHRRFSEAVSTTRQRRPDDAAWQHIRFMVFDLPAHPGTFDERIPALQQAIHLLNQPWVQSVVQQKLANPQALKQLLLQTVQAGGEGLMLHLGRSSYRGVRSDDLVKLKLHLDADAKVLAHVAGQGKALGLMGALWVETPEGRRFKLGTGFNDAERLNPPPVGSWISYRYRDINPSGLPRFASFLRVRDDLSAAN